jgi:hypothetical protein
MADAIEPKKETVRIKVSPSGANPQSDAPARSGETVRIHLPSRPPSNPPPTSEPPSPVRAAAAAAPAPMTTPPPKKETARITVLPDPQPKPAVEMKKTQPLIDLPRAEAPATKIIVTTPPQAEPIATIDQIPMPLCWALLAVSAAILILQIWNYLS